MITKERIVEESLKLFINYGVKSVTVERISKDLRMSKRTFYEHFENKKELLKECLVVYDGITRNEHEKITAASQNTMEALFRWNDAIMTRMDLVNPNFFNDIQYYYPGLLEDFIAKNGDFLYDTLRELCENGISEGLFNRGVHKEIFAKTVQSLVQLFKDTEMFPPLTYSKVALTFNILGPYIKGVCTEQGRDLIRQYEERIKVSYAGLGFTDLEGRTF